MSEHDEHVGSGDPPDAWSTPTVQNPERRSARHLAAEEPAEQAPDDSGFGEPTYVQSSHAYEDASEPTGTSDYGPPPTSVPPPVPPAQLPVQPYGQTATFAAAAGPVVYGQQPPAQPPAAQPYVAQPYADQPYTDQPYTDQPPPPSSQNAAEPLGPAFQPRSASKKKSPWRAIAYAAWPVAVIVIAAVILLIWKPSPFFKRVLDHTAVENTIQQQSNGTLKNVACPSNEQVKTGRTFQCTADGGKKVNVTITDGKTATYQWSAVN